MTYLNLTFLFRWSKISEVLVPHVWHQYGNPYGVTQRNSAVDQNRGPRQKLANGWNWYRHIDEALEGVPTSFNLFWIYKYLKIRLLLATLFYLNENNRQNKIWFFFYNVCVYYVSYTYIMLKSSIYQERKK